MIAVIDIPRHSLNTKTHNDLNVNTPESFIPDIEREAGGGRVCGRENESETEKMR